jgi:hypothetical protein
MKELVVFFTMYFLVKSLNRGHAHHMLFKVRKKKRSSLDVAWPIKLLNNYHF